LIIVDVHAISLIVLHPVAPITSISAWGVFAVPLLGAKHVLENAMIPFLTAAITLRVAESHLI
jgi:hypothetical protein